MQALLDSLAGTKQRSRRDATARAVTICHPIWRLARAGLEGQMMQTIGLMPRERFRHIVLVRDGSECAPETDGNVTIIHASDGRDRWWAMSLARLCREEAVDVLHVRGLGMLMDGALATQLCPTTRLTFSFHGVDRDAGRIGTMRRQGLRWALGRCAARWAVSESAAASAAELLGEAASSFRVMPNGVDLERFKPATDRRMARVRLDLPQDRVICLCVANLKPVKGQDVLLAAAALRPEWRERVTIVLAGGDYMDGKLQASAARDLPGYDIRFAGEVDDVLPCYHAADVFVLPSRSEGLSNAMLEAMACGLPVVATDVGAASEVLGSVSGPAANPGAPRLPEASASGLEAPPFFSSGGRTNLSHGEPRPPCRTEEIKAIQGLKPLATNVRPPGEGPANPRILATASGLLVAPDEPEALANAIDRLLGDSLLRSQLGGAARNRVVDAYNAASTAKRYAAGYEALAILNIRDGY